MSQGKLIFVIVLLFAALAGGLYFADWLVLQMLGLKTAPLAWNTWWQYFEARGMPQLAPFASKITLAGVVGFGVPVFVWLIALIPLFKNKHESLHGDARFAGMGDLRKAGLLKQAPESILIGKYKGRPDSPRVASDDTAEVDAATS